MTCATPGPWEVIWARDDNWDVVHGVSPDVIATCYTQKGAERVAEALNRAELSSSPSLLAACEVVVRNLDAMMRSVGWIEPMDDCGLDGGGWAGPWVHVAREACADAIRSARAGE